MTYSKNLYYLHRDRRFNSVRREFGRGYDLEKDFADAKRVITGDVVDFDLVYEGFTEPYLKLVSGIQLIFESLFEIFPEGRGRIDVTEAGIEARFVTRCGAQKVHTMINVGWERSPSNGQHWQDRLELFKGELAG